MSDEVPNRYRQELGDALPSERFRADATSRLLGTVQDALAQGVWQSTTADQFAAACGDQQRTATDAADRVLETLTARHAREPVRVDRDDWRARFRG